MTQHDGKEVATIAGGCFWCLEATFNEVVGIDKVVSRIHGRKNHESIL